MEIKVHVFVKQRGRNASKSEVCALVEGSEFDEYICPMTVQCN